jgi:hypothetical protein
MKKILTGSLLALLALSFIGCETLPSNDVEETTMEETAADANVGTEVGVTIMEGTETPAE